MGFHDRYATSKIAEENGTWIDFGDGVSIKARRHTSEVCKAKRLELEAPYKALKKAGGKLSTEDEVEILTKQIAQAQIIDWAGVSVPADVATRLELTGTSPVSQEGWVNVPYTTANVEKVLNEYPDFKNDVATVLFDRDTFKTYVAELDAKNS